MASTKTGKTVATPARPRRPADPLERYHRKRDFSVTAEPRGETASKPRQRGALHYVIQQHDATRMHFDFRLELDGVLKSWAVPKGPSLDVREKRLAVQTEDHPVSYRDFEGYIPEGEYGGGPVIVWDRGRWTPVGDPHQSLEKGHLRFVLDGEKLRGQWSLVRLRQRRPAALGKEPKSNWLLIKHSDEYAREGADAEITARLTRSVISERTVDEVAAEHEAQKTTPAAPAKAGTGKEPRKTAAVRRARAVMPMPDVAGIEPQLATLLDAPPADERYLYEVKFDGYRLLAAVENGRARIRSRNQIDWTDKFPIIARALEKLDARQLIVDGELCQLTEDGRTDFQRLQNTMGRGRRVRVDDRGLVFYLFDLLYLDGEDWRERPLAQRKQRLAELLRGNRSETLRYSDHLAGDARTIFSQACHLGLEGVIGKRADRPYVSGRGRDWIKLKCNKRQEFVIAGYTESDARSGFRSLILATRRDGRLIYSGKVGTGFNAASHSQLSRRLSELRSDDCPVENAPHDGAAIWVRPVLVCEVSYTEITRDGSLRHPSFKGLREDKPAQAVRLEVAAPADPSATPRRGGRTVSAAAQADGQDDVVGGVKITHPDRVMDAASGLTKLQLARYHERVSERFLQYAADRPLALVRCPQGDAHACFFQKHAMPGLGKSVKRLKVGGQEALGVSDARGVYELVQFNAMEFHGWGAKLPGAEKPDWIVFDLDPDTSLDFSDVVEAALEVRESLCTLGFTPFVKTTGGKGVHVLAPLLPRADWDSVKAFTRHVAETLARLRPERYVANMSKARRSGRIFIDYLRNGRGATAILPYSPRARPGATVAVPVDWKELPKVHPQDFTVGNARQWLGRRRDPWAELRERAIALPDLSRLGEVERSSAG